MFTSTEICNIALNHIGQTNEITDLETETSKAAKKCRTFYNLALTSILSDFPWSFARRTTTLALLTGEESQYYSYVYAMPDDCLEPRAIIVPNIPTGEFFLYYNSFFYGYARGPLQTSLPDEYRTVFEKGLTADAKTRTIMTNQDSAMLLYTARVTNTSLYTASFVDALALRLAAYLAMPMAQSPQLADALQQKYALAISQAGAQDLRGENSPNEPIPDSVVARLF